MATKAIFLTTTLFFILFSAYSQIGYMVIFGGDFDQNTVVIKNKLNHFYFKEKIEADHSTSISKSHMFFDSAFFDSKLKIRIEGRKKSLFVPLAKTTTIKYLYIWYYKQTLSYECRDKPLDLE